MITQGHSKHVSRAVALLLLLPSITFFGVVPSLAAAGTKITTPNTPTATNISNCVSSANNCATTINVSFTGATNAPAGTQFTVKTYSSSDSGVTYTVLANTLNTTSRSSIAILGLAANTSYKVTVTANGSGSFTTSDESNRSATVTTKPFVGQVQPNVAAVDGTVDKITVSFSPVTNAGSYSLQVYLNSNKVAVGSLQTGFTSGSTADVTLSQNTAYVVKVIANTSNANLGSSVSEFSAVVTTNSEAQAPSFANPESVRKNPGQSATFSVTASAADSGMLTYKWQVRAPTLGSSWEEVSGATQSTLTLDALSESQNLNSYRVVVRNTLNGTFKETTSSAAILTVQISSDASLSSLSVTPGTMSPRFSSSTSNYSISISATVTSLTISASPLSDFSSMTLNDSALLRNEQRSVTVDTNSQSQVISIRVTAEDASTRDYVVTVKRVINNKTSTVVSPQVAPTKAATPTQPTKQIIQTPTVSLAGLSVSSGPVGTIVMINGKNLNAVLNVRLNGLRITPDFVTPTAITLTIPAGARTGTFILETSKGTSSTSRFTVTT